MKQFIRLLSISAVLATVALADGIPQLFVYGSLAPNRWGSASYDGYAANALSALEGQMATAGNQLLPTGYSQVSQINSTQNVVTNFNSWLGSASPTGAFANEIGNRLTFGLYVNGEGSEFSAGEISFTMQSSDPSDALGYTDTIADLGSGTGAYGTSGSTSSDVLFGYNGSAWVQVTDSITPYYDLAFVGMGDAPAALTADPGNTNQDRIDAAAASISGSPYTVSGTYTLNEGDSGTYTGSATVNVATPEPAALLLLGTMFAGVWALRRKRLI